MFAIKPAVTYLQPQIFCNCPSTSVLHNDMRINARYIISESVTHNWIRKTLNLQKFPFYTKKKDMM